MQFLQEAIRNLPQAVQSPFAFVAYLGVTIACLVANTFGFQYH